MRAIIDTPRFVTDYNTEKFFYLLNLLNLNELPDIWVSYDVVSGEVKHFFPGMIFNMPKNSLFPAAMLKPHLDFKYKKPQL